MVVPISAYILAYNEQDKITAAIESVAWADEVLVIDSGSTDDTARIAERLGARVVQVDFDGFGRLRNEAIAACAHDWIFSLDADERCTPAARDEIRSITNNPQALDAYHVPRRNYFLGRWIRHGGWYPDYRQPQLFVKGRMRYDEDPVHEGFILDGELGAMRADIWQFPFKDLEQFLHKTQRYSTLGADKLAAKGVRAGMAGALGHALWAFIRLYLLKRGFLDGWPGFVIAFGYFEQTFYKYAKLAERGSGWLEPPDGPPDA